MQKMFIIKKSFEVRLINEFILSSQDIKGPLGRETTITQEGLLRFYRHNKGPNGTPALLWMRRH